jgi:hypothetical protein
MSFLYFARAVLFLGSLFIFSFCSRSINEIEPDNDTRKQASRLDSGQKITGTFYSNSGTDIDYLYIPTEIPVMIAGELTAVKGIDSEILFFKKGDGIPFKIVNDNKSSLNEKFGPYFITEPGVVIAIRSRQPVNADEYKSMKYEFSYHVSEPPLAVEVESNDSLETANEINSEITRGYYNNALSNDEVEKDFYSIDLPEKKKYRVSVKLSGVAEIDSILRMYSGSGDLLQIEDSGISGEPENIFSYGFDGPGKVYFSVNAKDYKVSEASYYELKVTVDEYEEKFELEPNNTVTRATSIAVNQIFGDFSTSDDVDYYKYFNNSFESIKFGVEVLTNSNIDVILEIFPLASSQSLLINDSGPGSSEGIANYHIKPLETVYIKVSTGNTHGSGAYTLNTSMEIFEDGFEKEPNNTPKAANTIFIDKPVMAYISPKDDQDWFKIKIPDQLRISIDLENPSFCRASLAILDSKGNKTDGKTASSMGDKISLSSIVEPNGYIKVTCEDMDKPGYLDPYKIRIVEDH